MTDLQATIGGREVQPAPAWSLEWLDAAHLVAMVSDGRRSLLVAVEGSGTNWVVTVRGRRIPVAVRSWRERMMADAEVAARVAASPLEVRATLPGLVVSVHVVAGQGVSEGDPLLTIEAMKMQNEVRAPRSGRVSAITVEPGATVATGSLLLRLDPEEPSAPEAGSEAGAGGIGTIAR